MVVDPARLLCDPDFRCSVLPQRNMMRFHCAVLLMKVAANALSREAPAPDVHQ